MWMTFHRARRRIGGGETTTPPIEVRQDLEMERVEDAVIVLGRLEIECLRHALQRSLGDSVDQPNSPARMEHALELILGREGLPGRPRVLRLPAALSTPESWEIHLDGVEHTTVTAIRDAGRTGRFS
jgi:hypothetical protein